MHYCSFDGNLGITLPICIVLIILWFYILGTTADGYLSPALETLAVKLKISESVAGVTFLAFGNGAPDVISALSASGGDGIYLAIGALLGAGLFVTWVVAAVVILSAPKPIEVFPQVFLRDSGFYILGPIIIIIAAFTNELSLAFSLVFLILYIVFVVVVFISDRFGNTAEVDDSSLVKVSNYNVSDKLEFEESKSANNGEYENLVNRSQIEQSNQSFQAMEFATRTQVLEHQYEVIDDHFTDNNEPSIDIDEEFKFNEQTSIMSHSIQKIKHKFVWSMVKMRRFLK